LQAGNRLEEPHDLLGAQHHRQRLRLARSDNAFGGIAPAQGDAVEEAQRAHGLVDVRPRPLLRDQVQLVGPHVLRAQPIGRAAEMPAELGDRVDVGLLGRRREIADHHVVDHPPTKRAGLSHRKLLSDEVGRATPASQTGDLAVEVSESLPRSGFVQSVSCHTDQPEWV
jgi:hypothetical protein